MNKIKAIIVDDERLAREEIRRCLAVIADVEVIGEAENADDAETLIRQVNPDLVFLDIKMPGRSGFDLLELLDAVPEIIFTTAFDNYAVRAFEVNAIDYLVKPIREERFEKAMEKVRMKLSGQKKETQQFFIREGERFYFIKPSEIYLIESLGNYAKLYFGDKKVCLKRSLNQLEKMLDPLSFFRINRTAIINTAYIRQVDPLPKGKLVIRLQTGEILTVSGRQSAVFKSRNKP